ncbi:MAG: SDR family oxidoreductase [Bdellovibrionales bacterium]|nr:SDR family oxidoreductase [Bdellovibrionales bacterium]
MIKLDGQTALITGASSGIGEGLARALHRAGANVVLVARRKDLLEDLARELNQVRSGSAEALSADLSIARSPDEQLLGLEEISAWIRGHSIDILVNNAGFGSFGPFHSLSIERELEMVRLNIEAPLVLTHAVLPQLLEKNTGGIIFLASIAAFQPIPYMATYAGTKAFDFYHGLALRSEYRNTKIRFLTVCPGPVQTEFGGVARVPGEMTNIPRNSVDQVVREVMRAYSRGSSLVVPCFKAKFLAFLSAYVPKRFSTRLTEMALRSSLPKGKFV